MYCYNDTDNHAFWERLGNRNSIRCCGSCVQFLQSIVSLIGLNIFLTSAVSRTINSPPAAIQRNIKLIQILEYRLASSSGASTSVSLIILCW
jgi:hypothetical protein